MATQRTSLFHRRLEPDAGWDAGREAVTASQRARMLEAVVQAVAEHGYANVTVADVVGVAGVSRRTFYEQFADKQDCFLSAYRTGVEVVVAGVVEASASAPEDDWRERLRVGLEEYARLLASEPTFARTLLIDVLGAGREAVELRQQLSEEFVRLFEAVAARAAASEAAILPVPDVFLRALVGGIGELVQQHIVREGAETLEDLAPTLARVAETVIAYGGRRPD